MNFLNSIDLAYVVGNLLNKKKHCKLKNDELKLYFFHRTNLSIVVAIVNNNKYTLYMNPLSDIVDAVDFFDEIFMREEIKGIPLEDSTLENLIVDRYENGLYTILTEDNISIELDEDFFDEVPKDGDILDENLSVNKEKTEDKKSSIADKFNKLKKQ